MSLVRMVLVARFDHGPQRAQSPLDLDGRNLDAEHRRHRVQVEVDLAAWRRYRLDLGDRSSLAPAGDLADQRRCADQSRHLSLAIDTALEAVAGLAAKAEPARGPRDRHRIEAGAFDQDRGGCV